MTPTGAQAHDVLGAIGHGERTFSLIARAAGGLSTTSLSRALDHTHLPTGTEVVGSYWTRTNDPEIDVVCGDRSPVSTRITAVGSIKWHDEAPFDARDLARLAHHRDRLPGADPDVTLLAVSRTGCAIAGLPVLTPTELITAWPA